MNRPAIQAVLCIILCPLLPAQQNSQTAAPPSSQATPAERYITLPEGTNIELLPPGPTKFARQKPGALVEFVLDRDVSLNGKPVIRASIPVVGVVDSVQHRSQFKHRPAEMNIRVTEMVAGQPTELHLRCFDPDDSPAQAYDEYQPHPAFNPVTAALITVGVIALLALVGGDR